MTLKPSSAPTLLLRADASVAVGTGHVMRCLALAQAWIDQGGRAVWVAAELPGLLQKRLGDEGIAVASLMTERGGVEDSAATVRLIRECRAEWVAVDGYCFDADYYAAVRQAPCRVLAIDDIAHAGGYPVDAVLNQNLGAREDMYAGKVGADTAFMLGPRFSLLRREFRRRPASRESWDQASAPLRVLVSFGGADRENYTAQIMRQLANPGARPMAVVVLVGAANPHAASLRVLATQLPYACEVRVNVADVAAAMAGADVAITAGGSTIWELGAARLPALIGAHEENQLVGLTELKGVASFRAMTLEQLLRSDLPAELQSLAGQPWVECGWDERGAERVAAHLGDAAGRNSSAVMPEECCL